MHLLLPNLHFQKNAPAINAIIGSFAPQGTNVVVMIVILRSRSFSIVLDAMIPGTPHPLPINIGMNDFPERPNFLKILSMINATLAIYPQLSRKAKKINNTSICGTKPSTAPTPATIPSRINPCNQPAQLIASSAFPIITGTPGTQNSIICRSGSSASVAVLKIINCYVKLVFYISIFIFNFCFCSNV